MICQRWAMPMIHLFATRWNKQLPLFVSPIPDPLAWAVDALSFSWEGLIAYTYPPSVLVPKVLLKLRDSNTVLLLVAPFSWNKSWTTDLATDPPLPLPTPHTMLKQPRRDLFHPCPEKLLLHAWRLCGRPSPLGASRARQWRLSLQLADLPLARCMKENGES